MNFSIFSRGDEISNKIRDELEQDLLALGFLCNPKIPDIVISVGGDGTLLKAFHYYPHRLHQTAFIGIHTGHLGFYADWRPHELEELISSISKPALKTVDYPLLELTIDYIGEAKQEKFLALNECTVKTIEGSLVMDIEINKDHFETFRGDGLCISTPSGSTAYNKSLGGAIIHPSICAMQIAEMASINNRVYRTIGSPLVLPYHHTCVLKPMNDRDYRITIDHISLTKKNVKEITFNVADEKVRFARYKPFPFWQRVRESFIDS